MKKEAWLSTGTVACIISCSCLVILSTYLRVRTYVPVVLTGFLTSEECDEIVHKAESKGFERSTVVSNDQKNSINTVSVSRTSQGVFLSRLDSAVVSRIHEKAACLTGRSVSSMEDLQVVKYKRNQTYKDHYDACFGCDHGKDMRRMYTLLIYLNDDFEGGSTMFRKAHVGVVPRKGSAVLFKNMTDDGRHVEWHSEHRGDIVRSGTKYACNVWIR